VRHIIIYFYKVYYTFADGEDWISETEYHRGVKSIPIKIHIQRKVAKAPTYNLLLLLSQSNYEHNE